MKFFRKTTFLAALLASTSIALAQSPGAGQGVPNTGGGGGGGGSGTVTSVNIIAGTNVTISGTCNSTTTIGCTINATGGSSTLTPGATATSGGAAGPLMYDTGSLLAETTLLTYLNGLLTANLGTLNSTLTDADLLTNTAAAIVSQNQISPALHFIGQGWKTATTAGSEQVEFREYLSPATGVATPTAVLLFTPTVNSVTGQGIAFLSSPALSGNGTFLANLDGGGALTAAGFTGLGPVNAAGFFGIWSNGSNVGSFGPNKFAMGSGGSIGFTSAAIAGGTAADTALSRCSAGVLCVGTGVASSVAGQLEFAGLISASTKPTSAFAGGTCAGGTPVGGAIAGTATLTGVCAVTNTWTLSAMPTAPNGYACSANDRTTPATLLQETSTSATTAVFTFSGTTGATDVLQFDCIGY